MTYTLLTINQVAGFIAKGGDGPDVTGALREALEKVVSGLPGGAYDPHAVLDAFDLGYMTVAGAQPDGGPGLATVSRVHEANCLASGAELLEHFLAFGAATAAAQRDPDLFALLLGEPAVAVGT